VIGMSVTTLPEAKLHLRVDGADEDTLIQAKLNAAELAASMWIGRNLYADADALATARAAVAAALAAATASYVAASEDAALIEDAVEREIAQRAATDDYAAAKAAARMTHAGVVMNDMVKAAVLLTLGHLFANREDASEQALHELPTGARHLLQPFKVYG
jgi:hypothetical protein